MSAPKKRATSRKDPPREMLRLGARLKKALKVREMNQADLARASNTSPDQVSRVINGETVAGVEAQTVVKWAKALEMRLDWLLMDRDPMEWSEPVPVIGDDSAGVDRALDLLVARMEKRGLAVQVQRVPSDKDSDD